MGFKEIRSKAIATIKEGRFQHEARGEIAEKNLLLVGTVSPEQVVRLLSACKGTQYSASPHHVLRSIEVHVFRPYVSLEAGTEKAHWYIKVYFLDPDLWFISVHQTVRKNDKE